MSEPDLEAFIDQYELSPGVSPGFEHFGGWFKMKLKKAAKWAKKKAKNVAKGLAKRAFRWAMMKLKRYMKSWLKKVVRYAIRKIPKNIARWWSFSDTGLGPNLTAEAKSFRPLGQQFWNPGTLFGGETTWSTRWFAMA